MNFMKFVKSKKDLVKEYHVFMLSENAKRDRIDEFCVTHRELYSHKYLTSLVFIDNGRQVSLHIYKRPKNGKLIFIIADNKPNVNNNDIDFLYNLIYEYMIERYPETDKYSNDFFNRLTIDYYEKTLSIMKEEVWRDERIKKIK